MSDSLTLPLSLWHRLRAYKARFRQNRDSFDLSRGLVKTLGAEPPKGETAEMRLNPPYDEPLGDRYRTSPLVLPPECAEMVARETTGTFEDYEATKRVLTTGNALSVSDGVVWEGRKRTESVRSKMQKLGI